MIKAVFFDVANTLLDKPDLYVNIRRVLAAHGFDVSIEDLSRRHRLLSEVIEFPDKTSASFYHDFNAHLLMMLGIIPTEVLLKEIFDACTYLPWKEFEDVKWLREILLPKGVISNWDKSLPEKLQALVKLEFEWVLGSEQMAVRKPKLEFYQHLLSVTKLDGPEILYVGDSLKLDIQPALSLGIQAVLIDRLDLYPAAKVKRVISMKELNQFL